jgi:hypothetical protein
MSGGMSGYVMAQLMKAEAARASHYAALVRHPMPKKAVKKPRVCASPLTAAPTSPPLPSRPYPRALTVPPPAHLNAPSQMPPDEWAAFRALNGDDETFRMKARFNGKMPRLLTLSADLAELLREKLKAKLSGVGSDPTGARAKEDDEFLWSMAKPIMDDFPIATAGQRTPKLKWMREHLLNHPHF